MLVWMGIFLSVISSGRNFLWMLLAVHRRCGRVFAASFLLWVTSNRTRISVVLIFTLKIHPIVGGYDVVSEKALQAKTYHMPFSLKVC